MPRVAAIVPVKRRPMERRMTLAEGDSYDVLAASLAMMGIAEGDDIPDARMAQLLEADAGERARQIAWSMVGTAPRTRRQVEAALVRRKLPRRAIEEAIAALERTGYLDERAYARDLVEAKGRASRQGPLLVDAKLEESGVSRAAREEALQPLREDQRELARAALAKWLARHVAGDPRRLARAAADHLARRGFEPEVILEVIDGEPRLAGGED